MPSASDLAGVTSLVAYGMTAPEAEKIAANAAEAGVKNVVALMEAQEGKDVKAAADR